MTGVVSTKLIGLCDQFLQQTLSAATREQVQQIRSRLTQPPRVVVAGAVSSGKSTLVNALLRQQVAPVGVGETTRLVTWFRYGPADRVDVEFIDGRTEFRPMTAGRLPDDLHCRPEDVRRVVVELTNETLRHFQLIDTPGVNTTSSQLESAAWDALGIAAPGADRASRTALGVADAVVFLMPHARSADAELLASLTRLYGGTRHSRLTTIGVLSKVDRLTSDDDPWSVGRRIAARLSDVLRPVTSTITPVIGLLAETARCGLFTERHAAALRMIAQLTPQTRALVLQDATLFLTTPDLQVDPPTRRRLLDCLGLYGLTVALRAIDHGAVGAVELTARFDQVSGMKGLVDALDRLLLSRADLLVAHGALAALRRMTFRSRGAGDAADLAGLRNWTDRLEMDGALQRLQLLDQLTDINHGRLELDRDRRDELELLAVSDDPATRLGLPVGAPPERVRQDALALAATWTALANDPRRSPAEHAAARHVRTALELLVAAPAGAAQGADR